VGVPPLIGEALPGYVAVDHQATGLFPAPVLWQQHRRQAGIRQQQPPPPVQHVQPRRERVGGGTGLDGGQLRHERPVAGVQVVDVPCLGDQAMPLLRVVELGVQDGGLDVGAEGA
jgi:hypothetical protein